VHVLLPQLNQPRPGTRVAVLYDPEDNSRVELDQQPVSTTESAIAAITGARPDLAGAEVMGMPMTDMIRQATAAMQAAQAQAAQASTGSSGWPRSRTAA